MEIFRTPVSVPMSDKKINYNSKIMLMGSCFSEYMGQHLETAKFKLDNNPFGIVYNPLSVKYQLENLMECKEYSSNDLILNEGVWKSFDHHSKVSDPDKNSCLKKINDRISASHQFLKSADFLFLTFGTAYVYYLKSTGQVVSNCHKIPAREFDRKRATVQDIVLEYEPVIKKLLEYKPGLSIVFTVSPIRHWKDGAHENQLSKSILLLAIDEICKKYHQTFYFPSYEIVMDELRDYRFYAEDMLHPNSQAVNYIWGRFKECFIASDTILLMKEVEKVVQASKHRPFNTNTDAFQSFARQFYDKIQYLKDQFNISLENEETYFKSLL
jgi:hypothetical protein